MVTSYDCLAGMGRIMNDEITLVKNYFLWFNPLMKAKIIWSKEYADDNFHQWVAVDAGDWEEVSEEEYQLLQRWAHSLHSDYREERPLVIRQDDQSIAERIKQCGIAAQAQAMREAKAESDRKKRAADAKVKAEIRERKAFLKLKEKFADH